MPGTMRGTKSKMKSLVPIFECITFIYYVLVSMWGRHTGAIVYSGGQKSAGGRQSVQPFHYVGPGAQTQVSSLVGSKFLYLLNDLDPQCLIC